ncbi:hypothetical protein [Gellertiella hungarica]|uniref:Uncharacterized protein n=1 Tax=Gellertiella hungarica TaxID=1572859 RepID=A0A7W6J6H0_9HYPH|nr:hypothetical protein [Gellertiella hungarica]MBB4065686.1 hypothetical protein [Gellertiella hungarica]
MNNRINRVHSAFESLQAAILMQRLSVRGRPACFATNEQLSALGLSRPGSRAARRGEGPFEFR